MPLRDLLKKKGGVRHDEKGQQSSLDIPQDDSQFRFLRTTTNSEEEISPPAFPGDRRQPPPTSAPVIEKRQKGHSLFRRQHSPSNAADGESSKTLGDRLHLVSRSRSASSTSVNIPANLPEIEGAAVKSEENQAEWENRATLLAKGNALSRTTSPTDTGRAPGVSDPQGDV
jgi:hypothetical protein